MGFSILKDMVKKTLIPQHESDEMPTASQITRDVTSRFKQILKETSGNVISSGEESLKKRETTRTPVASQLSSSRVIGL